MSNQLDKTIRILGERVPGRPGTTRRAGFVALAQCDGRPYREFRRLAGGSKGDPSREFSPSDIWRAAVAGGFAIFEEDRPGALEVPEDAPEPPLHVPRGDLRVESGAPGADGPLNAVRTLRLAEGVTLDRPGIYAWEIAGAGVYIGKYTRKSRPLREYDKNVRRLLAGEPYRPQKPEGFRRVHHALAQAVVDKRDIELQILENCAPENLTARERDWIAARAQGGLNG